MDEERDIVVFEDDKGNELTMEVLDYLCYEGKEYALLSELVEDEEEGKCESCGEESCEGCDSQRDAYIMEIKAVGEDQEEFLPVEDALAEKLIEIFESSDFDEILEDEDDL